MQPLVSCAKGDPLPDLKVNAQKQLNLQIFFNTAGISLLMILWAYFSASVGISSSHVNAADFAGFIAYLFEWTLLKP